MEQEIQIKTPDNHIIYGTLNPWPENNETLLIFVHGLSGNQYEHHYFNAVPFFNKKGFPVFRFDFYSRKPRARPLSESSLTSHVKDLELVINHFKNQYQNLILIGHSLGSLVILHTDLSNISKIILWDPTTGLKDIKEKNGSFSPALDKYILHWGLDIIIGKKMVEERKAVNLSHLAKKITVPCKFIFAGECDKYEAWRPFLNRIKAKNEVVIVKGATHCFVEEGTEQKLFEETFRGIR